MRKQIQDALELAYKDKLGLTDKKVYARVAALGETYVAKEEDIPAFVEKAEDILKGLQGTADQGRTLATANAKIAELEAKLKELEGKKEDDDPKNPPDDWKQALADAVKEAIAPLTEELNVIKASNLAKEALTAAHDSFFGGDYAKKYKDQATDAWERAIELNEATGSKMTTDQLVEKASGYFNKLVSRLGVDTSKPFVADPITTDDEGTLDWSTERQRLIDAGKLPKDAQ